LSEQNDAEHPDTVRLAVLDASRSAMESLTREVSLCLRYHSVTFRGQRPLKVRVSGGEGGDPQLLPMLHSVLGIPVEPSRPLFNVDCTAMRGFDHRKPSGDWAVAMGLGLKRSAGKFAAMDGTPRAAAPAAPPTPALPAAATQPAPSPAPVPREAVHA
jgi:hypothetical protein